MRIDWTRAAAVLLHLGYGDKLTGHLRERGDDQWLRPWYESLRAHLRSDRRYLRNIPAEMQESTGVLYDEIAGLLERLPAGTRRWQPPGQEAGRSSRRKSG